MHIQAIIFDLDGVLSDSEPLLASSAVALFSEYGVCVPEEAFKTHVGTGEERYLAGVAEDYGVVMDCALSKERLYQIFLEKAPLQLKGYPGRQELFEKCRAAGCKMAVASSADRIKVVASLEHIGLPVSQWDAVVTGDDVSRRKPFPDIFLKAASLLNISPQACLVIEDAVAGIEAASRAGMRCIAVTHSFPREILEKTEADHICDSLEAVCSCHLLAALA